MNLNSFQQPRMLFQCFVCDTKMIDPVEHLKEKSHASLLIFYHMIYKCSNILFCPVANNAAYIYYYLLAFVKSVHFAQFTHRWANKSNTSMVFKITALNANGFKPIARRDSRLTIKCQANTMELQIGDAFSPYHQSK